MKTITATELRKNLTEFLYDYDKYPSGKYEIVKKKQEPNGKVVDSVILTKER